MIDERHNLGRVGSTRTAHPGTGAALRAPQAPSRVSPPLPYCHPAGRFAHRGDLTGPGAPPRSFPIWPWTRRWSGRLQARPDRLAAHRGAWGRPLRGPQHPEGAGRTSPSTNSRRPYARGCSYSSAPSLGSASNTSSTTSIPATTPGSASSPTGPAPTNRQGVAAHGGGPIAREKRPVGSILR
jgi:hypothetical protein